MGKYEKISLWTVAIFNTIMMSVMWGCLLSFGDSLIKNNQNDVRELDLIEQQMRYLDNRIDYLQINNRK
jgi:hypothetical protein